MIKRPRIIQTLYLTTGNSDPIKETLGFLSSEFNWMSWALSCMLLKKSYGEVHLYTNAAGYEVLINRLQLPYTSVHSLPEDLDFPEYLWAYPKLCTYQLQSEPFLHIDGDVFLWERFNAELLTAPLVAQNEEADYRYYRAILTQMRQTGFKLPLCFDLATDARQFPGAYNAGIIGGHDLDFFSDYTAQAFDFVARNKTLLAQCAQPSYNMIYEQVLFFCLALNAGKTVKCYRDKVDDITYPGFADLSSVPHQVKFVHLMGAFKKNAEVCCQLASRLRNDYPDHFYRIVAKCLAAKDTLYLNNYAPSLISDNEETKEAGDLDWQEILASEAENFKRTDVAFADRTLSHNVLFVTNPLVSAPVVNGEEYVYGVPFAFTRTIKPFVCDRLDHLLVVYLTWERPLSAILKHLGQYFDKDELAQNMLSFRALICRKLKKGCDNNLFLTNLK